MTGSKFHDENVICINRLATRNLSIERTIEAGLVLTGSEVKSLRAKNVSLSDAYVQVKSGQAYLVDAHIQPYKESHYFNHESRRLRKLLLHKRQIVQLYDDTQKSGKTAIPTKMYFSKGRAKVEIGVGSGRKDHDKRAHIKEKEAKRDMDRAKKSKR